MKNRIQHGFRIFLHLLKRVEGAEAPLPIDSNNASWLPCMAARMENAEKAQARKDWLGYETELFHLASLVLSSLESHQQKVGLERLHTADRWCWESTGSRMGPSFGSSPTKALAIAQAEANIPAGESYRVGLLDASSIQRYVPKTEWLTQQMFLRARKDHGAPEIEWPQLDPREHFELQTLLDGLVVAFFEQKGILPNFSTNIHFENRVVPPQAVFS